MKLPSLSSVQGRWNWLWSPGVSRGLLTGLEAIVAPTHRRVLKQSRGGILLVANWVVFPDVKPLSRCLLGSGLNGSRGFSLQAN